MERARGTALFFSFSFASRVLGNGGGKTSRRATNQADGYTYGVVFLDRRTYDHVRGIFSVERTDRVWLGYVLPSNDDPTIILRPFSRTLALARNARARARARIGSRDESAFLPGSIRARPIDSLPLLDARRYRWYVIAVCHFATGGYIEMRSR